MNCVTEESNNILGCSLTRNTPMQKVLYSACEMLPEKEKNLNGSEKKWKRHMSARVTATCEL